jgi:rubredoxin
MASAAGIGGETLGINTGDWLESMRFSDDFTRNSIPAMHSDSYEQYQTWMCLTCGFIYDEAAGLPDDGIPAGTRWRDLPINWTCPECGARKEDFEMVEI